MENIKSMAKVRFVFDGNTEVVVGAATDRGAKLMVTGVRRRLEGGETLIEVKGTDGSVFLNAERLAFVVPIVSGEKKAGGAKKVRAAAPKKAKGGKRGRR